MAVLRIYNDIVSETEKAEMLFWSGVDGVCFKDVDEFISSVAEDDNLIDLRLHCNGGSTLEGWAIVDKLRATGKTIEATVEGTCASMATIILLAASVRRGYKHAQLLIHEPYIPAYTLADAYRADDLQKIADDLALETNRFLDFYAERTGADRSELEALMKEDKFISMERAQELGFIHEIVQPLSAKVGWLNSSINIKNKTSMDEKKKVSVAQAFKMLGMALGVISPVSLELNTENGDKLTVEREEGEPAVGDKASPDGEHMLPDGKTIVVVDGVITEIRDPEKEGEKEEEKPEGGELAAAKERIAELETEVRELKSQAKTSQDKLILNAVAVAGGMDWLKRAASEYKPASRSVAPTDERVPEKKSKVQERLEQLRNLKKEN